MNKKITVRRVSDLLSEGYPKDVLAQEFVRINREAWPPPVPERYLWTVEKVLAQFKHCPELLYCALADEGKVVGTLSMLHVNEQSALGTVDWEKMSGDGTLSTHQRHGDCAFGVDLSVPPGAIAGDLLTEMGILSAVILANKKGVFLGSRAPRFHKMAHRITIEEHVGLNGQKTHDPEIRFYQAAGFRVVKIVPGYMEDPASLNYGIL